MIDVNSLVTHKNEFFKGIGCVAKVRKTYVMVNIGLSDVVKVRPSSLVEVDTSNCKTITYEEYKRRIITEKSTLNHAIIGNELKHFVGIGWITVRVVTPDDLLKYPRVVQ